MVDYKIVDRSEIPERLNQKGRVSPRYTAWRELFTKLPANKAVQYQCADRVESYKLVCSIRAALRHTKIKLGVRQFPNEDNKRTVYIWRKAG